MKFNIKTIDDVRNFSSKFDESNSDKEGIFAEIQEYRNRLQNSLIRLSNNIPDPYNFPSHGNVKKHRECIVELASKITGYDCATIEEKIDAFFNEVGYTEQGMSVRMQLYFYIDYLNVLLSEVELKIQSKSSDKLPRFIDSFARAHANQYRLEA